MGTKVALLMSFLCTDEASKDGIVRAVESIIDEDCYLLIRAVMAHEGTKELNKIEQLYSTPRVKIFRTFEMESLVESWNFLYAKAKALQIDYCGAFNTDDLFFMGGVRELQSALDENPDKAVSYGDFVIRINGQESTGNVKSPEEDNIALHPIPGPFALFRMSFAKKVELKNGLFSLRYERCADHHLWIRLWDHGGGILIKGDPVGLFNYRENSVSHKNIGETRKERLEIQKWARKRKST